MGICLKVNVIARLEYELAYYDSAVHRFNHYTTRTPHIMLSNQFVLKLQYSAEKCNLFLTFLFDNKDFLAYIFGIISLSFDYFIIVVRVSFPITRFELFVIVLPDWVLPSLVLNSWANSVRWSSLFVVVFGITRTHFPFGRTVFFFSKCRPILFPVDVSLF